MEKINKTKQKQIEAVRNYDKRKGLTTISCKITSEYKEKIKITAEKKGFKTINSYIQSLIDKDIKDK